MYYAAINSYSTVTSVGFNNTWSVIGFATKATRDAYVMAATDLATRQISSAEIKKYGGKRGEITHYDASGVKQTHMQRGEFFSSPSVDDRLDVATGKQMKAMMISGEYDPHVVPDDPGCKASWER